LAYEQVRDYDSALRLYQEVNDFDGMTRVLVASDRPLEAAKLLMQQRRGADAYKIFETIPQDHQDYRGACLIMAKMLSGQNRVDAAIALIQRAIKGEPIGPDTIDLYYALGVFFEQRANYPLALDIYTKVLGENIAYKDVALRQQGLRERLAHTAPAPPPQPSAAEKTTVFPTESAGARANPRYHIIEELGRGGMGVVYKANDSVLDRIVAYKVLPPDLKTHEEVIKKFNKEATALAKLHHPYIVTVFDAGGIGGEYYFVMEYIEGRNLKDMIRERGALPVRQTVAIFRELAEALNYAHIKGVIHRDIKTSNVMIQNDGHVKLMDFGLAKIFEDSTSDRTSVSGTPFYMSPEQTLGKGIDHRTDLYSLGVMMYEIAAGRVPFPTGDIGYHHLHTEPEPPRNANPNIPPALDDIILKCMKKDKEQRYQSAGDIIEDLKKIG
jgi:tetratricopeptide (TPR) repeat protein